MNTEMEHNRRRIDEMKALTNKQRIEETIKYLKACQKYRANGGMVSYTSDPTWLVDQAVNRRAGWPEDPSCNRGSAMPVNGKYPKKASGDGYNHLKLIAREINTPRLIVRTARLGEWRKLILSRLPYRIFDSGNLYADRED